MNTRIENRLAVAFLAMISTLVADCIHPVARADGPLPPTLSAYFTPPVEYAENFGHYISPVRFRDGRIAETPADWQIRKQEILRDWISIVGSPPSVLKSPKWQSLRTEQLEGITRQRVRLEVAEGLHCEGYLMAPVTSGKSVTNRPAVIVVFYEPESSVGLKGTNRDFARRLTQRGFITLSIGSPPVDARHPDIRGAKCQPLMFLAHVASNARIALASQQGVDPKRIGIMGHSYGGKWAMFAGAFDDEFAAVAVSDPGIVFDETRSNINYWEPWYLGRDAATERKPGLVTKENPRTGAYKKLIEAGRDLHEVHALICPRPFFVSGGSEDPPIRWQALNHSRSINRMLGAGERIGMSNRPKHDPTPASNQLIDEFFVHFLKP